MTEKLTEKPTERSTDSPNERADRGQRPTNPRSKRGSAASDPVRSAAIEIAQTLSEPNNWLVRRVIATIGEERTREFLQKTLTIEEQGGMMVSSGQRRRTPGGVFFYLVRHGVSAEEKKAIFPRNKQSKSKKKPQPAVPPPSWKECKAYIAKLMERPRGEAKQVKLTLIGRPKQVAKTKSCMVAIMDGREFPQHMPKGLPTPPSTPMSFAVFIAAKQWNRIADSLKQNADDELIIEGYPVFDPKKGVTAVLAQSATTKLIQRAKRQGHHEEDDEDTSDETAKAAE